MATAAWPRRWWRWGLGRDGARRAAGAACPDRDADQRQPVRVRLSPGQGRAERPRGPSRVSARHRQRAQRAGRQPRRAGRAAVAGGGPGRRGGRTDRPERLRSRRRRVAAAGARRLARLPMNRARPRRILFVCEAVTLAQVVRLATLARALDPARYQIHFASAAFDELIFRDTAFHRHALYSVDAATIDARVAGGRRLYGERTLARYVSEERALFAAIRPDVVVGDQRLSLAVSAAVDRVPYANLINAYWSPFAVRDGFPLPDHPIVRLLGGELAAQHFGKALPFVFTHFA